MIVYQAVIASPQDMANIPHSLRLSWKILDILAKVSHKLFLLMGEDDAMVLKGDATDYTAACKVAELMGIAGWRAVVQHGNGDCYLYVATSLQALKRHLVEDVALPEDNEINNALNKDLNHDYRPESIPEMVDNSSEITPCSAPGINENQRGN